MKLTPLLLAASLAANLALAAVLFLRQPAALPPAASTPRETPRTTAAPALAGGDTSALHAALLSGDAAALEAAGVSAEIARELTLGRALRQAAERAANAKTRIRGGDTRWWRSFGFNAPLTAELQQSRRELTKALTEVFGHDPFSPDTATLDFLPENKRFALRQITEDYDEMIAAFSARGIQLASDREKLKLLRAERERDIAALLTPDELAAYELRTSTSASAVRARYGDAIQSEEDFRTLYALQKSFDEQFPREAFSGRISPETIRARAEAERQMQEQMRAALGEEKYAALRRASDPDLRTVSELATRLNLAPSATDLIAAARDTFAAESQRINTDASLSAQDRRAQIQALAERAKSEVAQTLGSEAADAYGQRSPWINFLQNGMAYSTTPDATNGGLSFGNQSVYPVPPAGGFGPPRAMRAATAFSAGAVTAVAAPGIVFSGSTVPMENIQITSFAVDDVVATPTAPPDPTSAKTLPATPAPAPKQ